MCLTYREQMREAQKRILEGLLEAAKGNRTVAAELGGLNRQYFQKLIKDCGIPVSTNRTGSWGA